MRRMYSKEQLQKLIDEVSRLIAIEELDKVVPVPSAADNGKLIQVNATGTGYQLAAIGDLTKAYINNIYDNDENKRFVEGDITPTSALSDYVPFAKWSLSGTHLMLVMCIYNTSENDITISGASSLCNSINLPTWIKNKIYPMGETSHVAHNFSVEGVYPSDLTPDANKQSAYIQKASNDITINGINFTAKAGYYYRVEFDLIITFD